MREGTRSGCAIWPAGLEIVSIMYGLVLSFIGFVLIKIANFTPFSTQE